MIGGGLSALIVALMSIPDGLAADEMLTVRAPAPPAPVYGEPLPLEPWLDEVRAQRQAWETKREAARDAFEARRRANNPRAAAQQEAWEEEVRRRRAARLERMDQERELFRSLGPSQMPFPWPWTSGFSALPDTATGHSAPATPGDKPMFAPPGWDNHWYFRGF
jgi:hypothetical protein